MMPRFLVNEILKKVPCCSPMPFSGHRVRVTGHLSKRVGDVWSREDRDPHYAADGLPHRPVSTWLVVLLLVLDPHWGKRGWGGLSLRRSAPSYSRRRTLWEMSRVPDSKCLIFPATIVPGALVQIIRGKHLVERGMRGISHTPPPTLLPRDHPRR